MLYHNIVENFLSNFGSSTNELDGIETIHEAVWSNHVVGDGEERCCEEKDKHQRNYLLGNSFGKFFCDLTFFFFFKFLVFFFLSLAESLHCFRLCVILKSFFKFITAIGKLNYTYQSYKPNNSNNPSSLRTHPCTSTSSGYFSSFLFLILILLMANNQIP